jgi:hypothetical protein
VLLLWSKRLAAHSLSGVCLQARWDPNYAVIVFSHRTVNVKCIGDEGLRG